MTALMELQRSQPYSPQRVGPAVVAACMMSLSRWLKSNGVGVEPACNLADQIAPVIEDVVVNRPDELILIALTPAGLRYLSSQEDSDLLAFSTWAARSGAPILGLNPAKIDQTAWDIINQGGPADAKGRLH